MGEGTFYGPKLELSLKDAVNRDWQCGTNQLDFNLPVRFDISYVGSSQQYIRPVILRLAVYGSIERWIGILLKSYQRKLPLRVHPLPVVIATIVDSVSEFAREVTNRLKSVIIPVVLDDSNNTVSRKIKGFHTIGISLKLMIGGHEQQQQCVSLRGVARNRHSEIAMKKLVNRIEQLRAPPD